MGAEAWGLLHGQVAQGRWIWAKILGLGFWSIRLGALG
jgi:hypothetical protein